MSEFGEELRGNIRNDFSKHLHNIYGEKLAFLPVDVGLTVHLQSVEKDVRSHPSIINCTCKVACVYCNKFVTIDDADFKLYGNDHALYCVCKTCCESVPPDLLTTTLDKLYNSGVEIRVSDS